MNLRLFLAAVALGMLLGGCATIGEKKTEIDKNSAEGTYQKALIASNYGLDDEALKYLREALALDPGHFPSCYLLGLIYLKKENLAEARSAFEKCVELDPENPDTHARLGAIYQELGMEKEAESEYEKAFNINPSFVSSFNLARFNIKQGNLELALKYIQSAIKQKEDSGPSYNLQGVILNTMKRYPEAIDSFLMALKIDANDHIAGINLGAAYINNGEYDKARDLLTKILSLTRDPKLKEKINEYLEAIKTSAADQPR